MSEFIEEVAKISNVSEKMIKVIMSTWTDANQEACVHIAKLLINEVQPRLDADGHDWKDMELEHWGFQELLADCAKCRVTGSLEARHIKTVIDQCWNKYIGYDLIQYLMATKLLDNEVGGDELTIIVKAAMAANPRAVAEFRQGKEKAIGAIVGAVMKQKKASPQEVQEIIKKLIQEET